MRNNLIRNSCLLLCTVFSFSTANAMLELERPEDPHQYLTPKTPCGAIPSGMQWLEDDVVKVFPLRMLVEWEADVPVFPVFSRDYPTTRFRTAPLVRSIYFGRGLTSLSADNNDIFLMIEFRPLDVHIPVRTVATERIFTDLEEIGFLKTEGSFNNRGVPLYLKNKTENQYYVFHQHNYQKAYFVFASSDEPAVGRFFSVFADRKLIPDTVINDLMQKNNMKIKIEDFKTDINQLIGFINEDVSAKEAAGIHVTSNLIVESALHGLEKIADPKLRAKITWELIQEANKTEYFDSSALTQLCEQINDKDLPFFREAKILQEDFRAFSESFLNLMNVVQARGLPIKRLEAELKAFRDQHKS